jgi:hypothetical protein
MLWWEEADSNGGSSYGDLEIAQAAELVRKANRIIQQSSVNKSERKHERDKMIEALKDLGYNATLFRILGMERNLRDRGMEQIAIILRVVHNQILFPLHLREVCDRKQYLKISRFKKDLDIFTTGRNRPGDGAMNQMLITIPSDGPPCPLPNFSFLQNGNAKVLIRPYNSNKFLTSVE